MKHSDLPQHCPLCGADWPADHHGPCRECRNGFPCRADTTDTVAPDPPCAGSRRRLDEGEQPTWRHADGSVRVDHMDARASDYCGPGGADR